MARFHHDQQCPELWELSKIIGKVIGIIASTPAGHKPFIAGMIPSAVVIGVDKEAVIGLDAAGYIIDDILKACTIALSIDLYSKRCVVNWKITRSSRLCKSTP